MGEGQYLSCSLLDHVLGILLHVAPFMSHFIYKFILSCKALNVDGFSLWGGRRGEVTHNCT